MLSLVFTQLRVALLLASSFLHPNAFSRFIPNSLLWQEVDVRKCRTAVFSAGILQYGKRKRTPALVLRCECFCQGFEVHRGDICSGSTTVVTLSGYLFTSLTCKMLHFTFLVWLYITTISILLWIKVFF